MRSRFIGLVSVAGLLAAGGCAAIQESNITEEERMLSAAGFQMKLANTPERMKRAEALAQRKFTKVPYGDGSVRYVYADAKYCKCIYAGSEQAYGRYWKMAMQSAIATDEADAAMTQDLYGDSSAWGPWGPW